MALALDLANSLCSHSLPDEQAADAQAQLKAILELVQGVPVALGSGRSGLKHKIHGLAHSTRLTSNSWKQVAKAINATFSLVGDLGEKSIIRVETNLRRMFGDWLDNEYCVDDGATAQDDEASDFVFTFGVDGSVVATTSHYTSHLYFVNSPCK